MGITRQQALVLAALDASSQFRSVQQLHRELVDAGHAVGLTTIYRTIRHLADTGALDTVTLNGERLYRRRHHAAHHHNLVCRLCGAAQEINLPVVDNAVDAVAAANRFTEVEHIFELFGRCADCTMTTTEEHAAAGIERRDGP